MRAKSFETEDGKQRPGPPDASRRVKSKSMNQASAPPHPFPFLVPMPILDWLGLAVMLAELRWPDPRRCARL